MSFQPVTEIVEIPKTSNYVLIKDATNPYNVTTNPGGWGAPGGPVSLADVISVLVQVQIFGDVPKTIGLSNYSGSLSSNLKVMNTFSDGVNLIYTLYGVNVTNPLFTFAGNMLIVPETGSAFDLAWDGVAFVSDAGDENRLYRVKSVDNTTGIITLWENWQGTQLVKYYSSVRKVLILNCGESSLLKDIASMAVANMGCDDKITIPMMNRILLKTSAQASFGCGNYAKAHNAAVMFCNSNSPFKPCSTC